MWNIIGVICASACIFAVLYWWSEGAIEASEAVLLAAVFGGLMIGLFAARTIWQFVLAFVPLASALVYGIYNWKIGSWRSYYRNRRAIYEDVIRADPRNFAAREFLAETLYRLGDLDRAVDEMQAAVDMGAGIECQYKLGKWLKELHLRDTTNPVCRWCETENARGARRCYRCGADLPYETAFTRWLTGGRWGAARYWLLLIVGFAIAAVSWLLLPGDIAFVPFVCYGLTLCGWALISSARR